MVEHVRIWELSKAPEDYKALLKGDTEFVSYVAVVPVTMKDEFLLYNEQDFAFGLGVGQRYELGNGDVLIAIG